MPDPETNLDKMVVLDNTVLSNFVLVTRTDLVTGIWRNCVTTPDAWNEFLAGIKLKKLPAGVWKELPVVELSPEEIEFQSRLPSLGRGEGACLAVAYHRKGLLATDDQKARRIALQWGLEITGTLGFLLYAIRIDRVDLETANTLLNKMMEAGYHSPIQDLGEIM
jgi:predicted nucleic acid-binding protein